MKKLFILLSAALLFLPPPRLAYGLTIPAEFRIGLEYQYKNASSVPLGNTTIDAGYQSGGGFTSAARLYSASGFSIAPAGLYYAATGQYFSTYPEAKSLQDSYAASGRSAVTVCLGVNNWSVYLGGYSSEQEARNAGSVLSPNKRRIALNLGQGEALLFDNPNLFPQIADADGGPVRLGGRSYRGRVEFSAQSGSGLTPVNVVEIDQYLYSVVPSEIPSGWHLEAIKAQAVACRNYAFTRMGVHKEQGYDLCDGSHCQNYIGAGNESAAGIQSVNETKGLLIYYQNEPINAVYFSSSGGHTTSSGDVWSASLPYLVPVAEIHEPEAKVWNRSFTMTELTALLSANGAAIGQATGLRIGSLSPEGRVNQLVITGTNGTKTLQKEEIRNFFDSSAGGKLESRNFTLSGSAPQSTGGAQTAVSNGQESISAELAGLTALSSSTRTQIGSGAVYVQGSGATRQIAPAAAGGSTAAPDSSGRVYLSGRGWGHGVGMSQYGAKGMAEIGYNFIQILEYYYTGTKVY